MHMILLLSIAYVLEDRSRPITKSKLISSRFFFNVHRSTRRYRNVLRRLEIVWCRLRCNISCTSPSCYHPPDRSWDLRTRTDFPGVPDQHSPCWRWPKQQRSKEPRLSWLDDMGILKSYKVIILETTSQGDGTYQKIQIWVLKRARRTLLFK